MVGRMCKLTEVFWESVPKSWCSVGKGAVAELQPTSSIYLCQPAHFPCNSKIQSSNHFSKSHPWTRNSSQTTVQSRIYLSYPNCRNESSSPVSKAISPQTIS